MSTKRKVTGWFKKTVEVTAKHIEKAHKLREEDRAQKCPIALALRSLKLRNVEVNCETAEVKVKGKLYAAELPKAVINFITKFDHSAESAKKLKPFSFKVKFETFPVED